LNVSSQVHGSVTMLSWFLHGYSFCSVWIFYSHHAITWYLIRLYKGT
jgi:hypothetical protein